MKAWQQNIRQIDPYVAGEQPDFPDMIKLNTNENPYPPAPGVEELMKSQSVDKFRLYPDTDATPLAKELADFYQVKREQLFIGVGSDDVLAMCFLTFFNSTKPILFPDITYSFYDVWANLYRIPYKQPKLSDAFEIQKEDYMVPNGGIVLANPNAPTSIAVSVDFIEDIVKANPDVIVIVDEAYVDFGTQSVMPLINKYENLVVVQTFSKSRSMAGMRIGFAVANEELIAALNAVKNSYNSYTMNRPAIELGVEAVRDKEYFERTTSKIIKTREYVKEELKKLGFMVLDSKTNFLFITHPQIDANELFFALREKHIFVRHWNKPRIEQYLRVTIGTDYEMEVFLEFLNKFCEDKA